MKNTCTHENLKKKKEKGKHSHENKNKTKMPGLRKARGLIVHTIALSYGSRFVGIFQPVPATAAKQETIKPPLSNIAAKHTKIHSECVL